MKYSTFMKYFVALTASSLSNVLEEDKTDVFEEYDYPYSPFIPRDFPEYPENTNSSFEEYYITLTPVTLSPELENVSHVLEEDKTELQRVSDVFEEEEEEEDNYPEYPEGRNQKSQHVSRASMIRLDPYLLLIFLFIHIAHFSVYIWWRLLCLAVQYIQIQYQLRRKTFYWK